MTAALAAPRRGGLALLAALFVAALALRPQLVGAGPLLPEISDELAVSHAVAGLLGTIPVLCAVRDLTGSFATSPWALFATALLLLAACMPLSPTRLRPA